MALNDEIYALLCRSTALAAFVADRIYPVEVPEDQPYEGPFLVYSRVSNLSEECHDGSAGLATARYQFSAYAKTKDGGNKTCRSICEALRLLIQNYRGGSIQSCSHAGDHDLYEPQVYLYHVPADWMIQYSEPIPS